MKNKRKTKLESVQVPAPKFDPDTIAARLRHVDIGAFVDSIRSAIDEAKGMAGALPPDKCDDACRELNALQDVVDFVFEKEPK